MKRLIAKFNAVALAAFLAFAPVGAMAQTIGPQPGIPASLNAAADPTVNNDSTQAYQIGSLWQNANTGRVFVARSVAAGAAVWTNLELSDFPSYIANNWYVQEGLPGFNIGANPGTGSIRLYPGYIKQRITINALGNRVTVLSAGGNFQVAVYANNAATNKPTGNPLASTTSLSTASVASVNAAVSVQLEPGLYWWASNCDNATATFSSLAPTGNASALIGDPTQSSIASSGVGLLGYSVVQTFGTWPDLTSGSFTAIVSGTATVPMVQFKVGSIP